MRKVKEKLDKTIVKAANSIIQHSALRRAVSTEQSDWPGPGYRAPGNLVQPPRSQLLPRPLRPQHPIGHRPPRSQSLPRPIRPPHPTAQPPAPPVCPDEAEGYYSQLSGSEQADSEEGNYITMDKVPSSGFVRQRFQSRPRG